MAEGDPPQHLVFISYSSDDVWVAKQIARAIESMGAAYFLDEAHIEVGDDFEERIHESMTRADELLVYLTPWSSKRGWIMMEVAAAWYKRIPIIGLLHGVNPEDLSEMMPVTARRNLMDINEIDTYLKQLRERVRRHVTQLEES